VAQSLTLGREGGDKIAHLMQLGAIEHTMTFNAAMSACTFLAPLLHQFSGVVEYASMSLRHDLAELVL
jgi:hypothetical protein